MTLSPSDPSQLLGTLTDSNLDDLFESTGLARLRHSALGAPLSLLLRPAARRFAAVAHEFDRRVGEHGLARGSGWILQRMAGGARAAGLGHVPLAGPVFILANHPGMVDAVALLATLASRPDLRVIALDRQFLRALPQVAKHLIFVPDDEARRIGVVRAGVQHLRQGGALLTFPAGRIEPDPAVRGAGPAIESLAGWSDSFALFARLVPQLRCVPALVSHVVAPEALAHPLTWLRRSPGDKQKLAAALQVAMRRYQSVIASIVFGTPVCVGAGGASSLAASVVGQLRQLIETSFDDRAGAAPCAQPRERELAPRSVS
jgi:hypothetical protein